MELLYGRNPVYESLRAGRRPARSLFLAKGIQEKKIISDILQLAKANKLPVKQLDKSQLYQMARHDRHQGILLETEDYPYVPVKELLTSVPANESPFVLLLDLLQDIQNVGSLLRTADAVGVHGIILQERRGVGITPSVVNSSSGAAEHLHIAQVTNLVQTMRELKASGVWLYGLDQVKQAIPIHQANLKGSIGLVVGNEGEGIRRLVRETCDVLAYIPMQGKISSLNAAIAGSVALYTAWQQRGFT
ncbi:MAG: 23S rRNA (guanosine(2251)-2'-O)-methyltransferase RlmB [Anaerolineales bacterium]|nr:23S rRNA (guanosine(2251)-2'-O)-methyltransferase RlmB [Anaerolineales bacterium]